MSYSTPQINQILLKADRTIYKMGALAYEDMFSEDSEAIDYERDLIFIYQKAVEWADDFFVGTQKLDKVVERLASKIAVYDYGVLTPVYSLVSIDTSSVIDDVFVRKTTPLILDPGIIGPSDLSGNSISISLDYTYIKQQTRDYYLHSQASPSATWVINHNLGKFASVNVVDTANDEIIGDVRYNGINQITITFSTPVSGSAYIN